MLQVDEDVPKINVMPVQRQTNSVDCGIFAVAFLTWILFDEDEEGLLQMLAEQHIRCFPTFSLELYCSCVQPWFSKDDTVENKQIAKCDSCRKWFHSSNVGAYPLRDLWGWKYWMELLELFILRKKHFPPGLTLENCSTE